MAFTAIFTNSATRQPLFSIEERGGDHDFRQAVIEVGKRLTQSGLGVVDENETGVILCLGNDDQGAFVGSYPGLIRSYERLIT